MTSAGKPEEQAESVADKLRRANIANIVKKLNAGKTLTTVEQAALAEHENAEVEKSRPVRRLSKKSLAKELGVSKPKVINYLRMSDAPKPDKAGRYSVDEVKAFLNKTAPQGVPTENLRRMKESLLAIQLREATFEFEKTQGEYIHRREVTRTLAPLIAELHAMLHQKFEEEIPFRCRGKTVIEIQQMMMAALDEIEEAIRSGVSGLMKSAESTSAA